MKSALKRFIYTYRQIWAIAFRVNPALLVLVTIINSFWGLTNLPVLYINKLLIDVVISSIGQPDWRIFARTILILILVRSSIEFVRSILSRYSGRLSHYLARSINARMDILLGEKINSLDIPTLESPQFQDKYKKIEREVNQRVWGMISPISEVPNSLFTIVSAIIPILAFNPLIGVIVVIARIPEVIINAKLARLEYKNVDKLNFKYRLWGWINYHLTNSRHYYENKILGNTAQLTQKMSEIQNEILNENYALLKTKVNYRTGADIPNTLLSIVLNSYFFILAVMGQITLGLAQMLYQASNTLGNGFGMLLNNASSVYENYLFVSDLTWFLDLKPANSQGSIAPSTPFSSGIEFKHVWFKYPASPNWILKDVSFAIKPCENIALVGENGAGKTTLIKLLAGFYHPDKGEIIVNGVNVRDYTPASYWRTLSVLFQDFSEYPFTAQESIGYGDVSRIDNLKEIEHAAKLTGIHTFINSLPLKYQNPLTKEFDKGIEPSRGQWQRVALARMLFRNGEIVILDEPTSNVDPKAEEEIFEKLIEINKKRILFLISHRFSTVRRADKIILLNGGEVTEQGTHEELMKQNKQYAKLFLLQAKSYQ